MKIKEQDVQHMVIGPTKGERFLGVLSLVLVIAIICFIIYLEFLSALPVVLIFIFYAGKMLFRRIVFNRPTDSVILEARHFMLIHKKRIVSLSAVTDVSIERKTEEWWSQSVLRESWEVSIFIGDKGIKIDRSRNESRMYDLRSQISTFIGNNTDR